MAKRRHGPAKKRPAPRHAPKPAEPVESKPTAEPAKDKPKPAPKLAPPPEPAFWFGFEVSWAKLALARVVLFGLLAVDALMQIRHAPRYGAGGFNVGQLPFLDALGPTRASYQLAELVNAYLFVLAACGIATRVVLPIAAAIYAWLYFGSQLDSYQHHYLVSLVLVLACFVPWRRPPDAQPSTRVRAWAVRLILIQIAIMYLWAAISKMSPEWTNGHTLAAQIGGPSRSFIDSTIGIKLTALSVIAVELGLAATIWIPRAWPIAAPVGIVFHIGILASTLEIGLFAWIMLGLYMFALPDSLCVWVAEWEPIVVVRQQAAALARAAARQPWIVWLVAVAGSVALAAISRFHHALVIGCVLAAVPVAGAALRRGPALAWLATAHLLAFTVWTAVDRMSTVALDYYRFWGGTSRRLGDKDSAEHAYRELIAIDPSFANGHLQLGNLLLARGADDEGLRELHAAQELEPARAKPLTAEARWLAAHGKKDEALAKARQATTVEPGDNEARTFLDSLTGSGAPAKPARDDDDSR